MKSEVGLGILVEPTTEADPTRLVEGTEILLVLTLEGIDVDILLIGGTGVALGERVFLIVVLPILALEDALGDMDMDEKDSNNYSSHLSAFAGKATSYNNFE